MGYYDYVPVPEASQPAMARFAGVTFVLDNVRMTPDTNHTLTTFTKKGYNVRMNEKGLLKGKNLSKTILVTTNFKKARNKKLLERVFKTKRLQVVYYRDLADYLSNLQKNSGNLAATLWDTSIKYASGMLAGLIFGDGYGAEMTVSGFVKKNGGRVSKSPREVHDYYLVSEHYTGAPVTTDKKLPIVKGLKGLQDLVNVNANISLIESL